MNITYAYSVTMPSWEGIYRSGEGGRGVTDLTAARSLLNYDLLQNYIILRA
jgi:hypothetical protein